MYSIFYKLKVNWWILKNRKKIFNYAYSVKNGAYVDGISTGDFIKIKGNLLFKDFPKYRK